MKFIPPLEISSKIMTLIEEAEKELILVSPYVEVSKWDKMKKCLDRAIKRGVNLTFIARKNAKQDLSPLEVLNIKPILINDLHAKVYINEKYGIVTSQNIVNYSDINSIDIAYQTENNKERAELIDFVNKYITTVKSIEEKIKPIERNIKPIGGNIVHRIEKQNYDDKKQFKDYEVEKVYKSFVKNFQNSYFKRTATYVFCDDLLPFADVMIDTRYLIKISKNRTDCELIFKKVEEINFNNHHKFKIELLITHKSFYYLDFIPIGSIQLDKLILDYINITNSILKSDVIKVHKIGEKHRVNS